MKEIGLHRRAVGVLLIGAGRIGLVHALTLSRLPRFDLKALIDQKKSAPELLWGMGLSTPSYSSLDDALREVKADAAVIAPPPSSHLSLSRLCLSRGLSALIKRPLAVSREQLTEYKKLAIEFPHLGIQAGYVMPRNPQVSFCIERLRAGEFGKVEGFMGFSLLSLMHRPDPRRWEVGKEISGGGVLINAGAHVLSMIQAAFDDPVSIEAQSLPLYFPEIEDSMVTTFQYPGFQGVHYCSWSIRGCPRQKNRLVVRTERGHLILTASVGVFVERNGESDLRHQLDYEVGFNLAPNYAGAGFSRELADLKDSVRDGQVAPMNVSRTIQLEELLFRIYAGARPVSRFEMDRKLRGGLNDKKPSFESAATRPPLSLKRVLDLRELSRAAVGRYFSGSAQDGMWDEYLLIPSQLRGISRRWLTSGRLRVTVPDFLQLSRLLWAKQYLQLLGEMGIKGVFSGGWVALPELIKERGVKFWVGVMVFLAAGLARVPSSYRGSLLLHSYVTDLALALERRDVLERMLKICRRLRPRARIGFHTNLAGEAANVLPLLSTQVDEISVLTSPQGLNLSRSIHLLREISEGRTALTAEVGLAPAVVHQIAARSPEGWTHRADAILLGVWADTKLAELLQAEKAEAWSEAFPGLSMPEAAL